MTDPRNLLTPKRLDYVIKWRFLRHIVEDDDPDSERVYRWHIQQRTGGREPQSWKRSVDDYVACCGELIESLVARGFRSKPLPVGRNGIVLAGAHRLAAAIALQMPVPIQRMPKPGLTWDEAELRRCGMLVADLERVVADYDRLTCG